MKDRDAELVVEVLVGVIDGLLRGRGGKVVAEINVRFSGLQGVLELLAFASARRPWHERIEQVLDS